MAEESDQFSFDQPWNPISYFEEEQEATGTTDEAQYSPTQLASLFETNVSALNANVNAINDDIERSKNIHYTPEDSYFNDYIDPSESNIVENFTIDAENGLRVLDTTVAINRKAIFSDFDRFKKWQQSLDKGEDKDELFIDESDALSTKSPAADIHSDDKIDNHTDINLLLDPYASIVEDENKFENHAHSEEGVDRIKQLEKHMSETSYPLLGDINELSSPVNEPDVSSNTIDLLNNLDLLQDTQNIQLKSDTINTPTHSLDTEEDFSLLDDLLDEQDDTNISATPHENLFDLPSNVNLKTDNLAVRDSADDLINSSDTHEADRLVEIASNIVVTPPTPDTADLIELPKTIPDSANTENVTEDHIDISKMTNIESSDTASDVTENPPLPPPYNDSTSYDENGNAQTRVQIENVLVEIPHHGVLPCEKNDVNPLAKATPLTGDYEGSSANIEPESQSNESSSPKVSGNKSTSSDTSIGNVPVSICSQVNISSVSDEFDSLKCLTPDIDNSNINENEDDDEDEPQDVEAFMSSQTDENNKLESIVSPLPDVNFEIQKGHRQLTNAEQDVAPEIVVNVDDTPGEENIVDRVNGSAKKNSAGVVNSSVEEPKTNGAETSAEENVTLADDPVAERNVTKEVDNSIESQLAISAEETKSSENLNLHSSVNAIHQTDEADHSVKTNSESSVGFSNDVQESVEDLDRLLHDLESEIDIVNETTINKLKEDDTNAGLTESENVGLPQSERVEEVALAATSNTNDAGNAEQEASGEAVVASDDTAEIESPGDGNIELRTSLRRTGSTSGSGRRVRFSLNPQYEGDESDETEQTTIEPSTSQELSTESNDNTPENLPQAEAAPVENADQCIPPVQITAQSIPSEIQNLGWVAPEWVPDEKASNCMKCGMKFTVVKRRHHCRACGKVLCSVCCNMKYCLPYLNYKCVRVCQSCCDTMVSQAFSDSPQPGSSPSPPQLPLATSTTTPSVLTPPLHELPQAPPPYSETEDGHTERLGSASSDVPPYSEVPTSQYLEQPAPILPAGVQGLDVLPAGRPATFTGAQLTEMMNFQLPAYTPTARQRQNRNRTESEMSAVIMFNSTVTNLPPILRRNNEETRIVNNPDLDIMFRQIHDENEDPISFIVNKNLVVRVKVFNLDCCVEKKCWCFTSDGMGASNQEEVVILIKCESYDIEDRTLARRVLQQMNHIFEKAKHGHPVSDLEQLEFDVGMCCMPKNIGMLFFKQSLQCIKKLIIPTSPYLFGMYIERSEQPWAKNFPLRLLLRVGAEYKYYPSPLFNILDRPAVYDGVGRTILDLLADFRNFQYTIPRVVGVTINLRGKDTIIRLPQHRYDEILKAVNSCEENVLSLAGNFSSTCDGHLVSVEKDGRYKTQTLSIVLKANRKVTCASFIVISAALKINQEGIKAKASIVEDGVMVQVTSDIMKEFKQAIKDMKEYSVTTGDPTKPDETSSKVGIEWTSTDYLDRPRLLSPIDGTSFDNLTNMKIRHSYDYTSNSLTAKIHWVEVYFLPQDNDTVQRLSARELGQMTSSIAKACMSALSPHLMTLLALDMTRIGLRVNLAADFVEYKIGANLATLPGELLPNLDDKLVPAIHTVMSSAQERVAVELIFQVVRIV